MLKTCVIFNPSARGEKAAPFRSVLTSLTSQCSLRPTRAAGHARTLAAEAVREGFEIVVAAGGDGTLNEVLNGIGDVPGGFAQVRLAALPLGTVNVFAKEWRIPPQIEQAWQVVVRGRERSIDLPLIEFGPVDRVERRYFAQMAGAGWDSRAIELVDWGMKKRMGALAYVFAGLKAWREDLPELQVTNGRETVSGKLVLIGNGAYYGGRYRLFPAADASDGLLEVTAFPKLNLWAAARATCGYLFNHLYSAGGVAHLRGQCLELSSPVRVALQVEGENIGFLPARFTVAKQALRIIVP